ncbi:MAG TPA: hydantoinase B/oxoprolinase family protein, partial [Bacillota bacterium]
QDFGLGIYDRHCRLLAESPGLAVFTRANDWGLQNIVRHLGEENIHPGDCYLSSYPYWSASHTLDVLCASPIFHRDHLVGFTAVKIHWLDLGQKNPGYVLDSTDLFQEGLIMPAAKIYKNGRRNLELEELIRFNSRMPDRVIGDMNAQISSCRTGERRVQQLIEKFGLETYNEAVEQILSHGERIARARLAELPKGTWTAEDYVDEDGIDLDTLLKIKATVTITEDEFIVDFTGSHGAARGPMNLPYGLTLGVSALAFKGLTTPDWPANEGHFRPLKVIAPEGSLMHAVPPAPTFMLWTGLLTPEVILKAVAQAMPDAIPACSGGDVCSMMGVGINPRNGQPWVEATNEAVGFGGHAGGDGEDGIMHLTEPGCQNNPVEVLETKAPMLIESYGLRRDSGGPGKHRGGLGVQRTYRFLAPSSAITLVKKTRTRPWGLGGGKEGDPCHVILRPGTPQERRVGSVYEAMDTGEVLVNCSGGGGGWGDPFQRDPQKVLEDVRNDYVSLEAARRDYGVVIDPGTMTVDEAATRELRAAARSGAQVS